jgi:hypothetical protein
MARGLVVVDWRWMELDGGLDGKLRYTATATHSPLSRRAKKQEAAVLPRHPPLSLPPLKLRMTGRAEQGASEADESDELCNTRTLFAHREEAMELLRSIVDAGGASGDGCSGYVSKWQLLLDNYLEQPVLLDPHLQAMMDVLMPRARGLLVQPEPDGEGGSSFPYQMKKNPSLQAVCAAVYHLCRVRGYKAVMTLLPHEAADLEPVLLSLQCQDRTDYETWETRYVLLLWLSMLCLIPFDMSTVDSSSPSSSGLVPTVISLCKDYLGDAALTRDAASVCLGQLLTRPDVRLPHLPDFVLWGTDLLQQGGEGTAESLAGAFRTTGVLSTLAAVFKRGDRDVLGSVAGSLLEPLVAISEQDTRHTLQRKLVVKLFQRIGLTFLPPRVQSWRYERGKRSLLENLAISAVPGASRAGQEEEKVRSFEQKKQEEEEDVDVPEELEEVIEQLLRGLRDRDTVVRWSAAKGIGRITGRLPADMADDVVSSVMELCSAAESDSGWHGACLALAELARRGLLLPERLPSAVPIVVRALGYDVRRGAGSVGSHVRDAACYVCWAFARAYSPAVLRPHVAALSDAMLTTALFDREINVRRAASAAFQENVGRQGHQNFEHGIEIVTAADFFTLGNRAAAYLDISVTIAAIEARQWPIVSHLLSCKVSHWDTMVRELTAKALGRLAPLCPARMAEEVLPSLLGRSLSTDLFERHGALLACGELLIALASTSSSLLSADAQEAAMGLVPKLEAARLYRGRGGEMVRAAVCRFIECLALAVLPLTVKTQLRLLDTIDECLKHATEDVQTAAAAALGPFLCTYFPVGTSGASNRLLDRTSRKYAAMLGSEVIASTTRGAALALGSLPAKLLPHDGEVLQAVIDALIAASAPQALVGGEGDAETRRNSIEALVSVASTVGIGKNGLREEQVKMVMASLLAAVADYGIDKRGDTGSWCRMASLRGLKTVCFLAIDASSGIPLGHRGIKDDEELDFMVPAVDGRIEMQAPVAELGAIYFDPEMAHATICAVLKQLSEKLDAVRECAGQVIEELLTAADPPLLYVQHKSTLALALNLRNGGKAEQLNDGGANLQQQPVEETGMINWSSPAITFPKLSRAMSIPCYHNAIISGLIISVGGLTESVVKHSKVALLTWVAEARRGGHKRAIGGLATALMCIFDESSGDDRVSLPLLKTLDVLLSDGAFDGLTPEEHPFAQELVKMVRKEIKGSKNVQKICAAASVILGLVSYAEPVRQTTLRTVMSLLAHRVRLNVLLVARMPIPSHSLPVPSCAKAYCRESLSQATGI